MNKIHKTIFMGMIVLCIIPAIDAQEILTLDKAISIAETGSPDLKRSMLNLEQFQKNLEAQRAALKSRFSLDVSPVAPFQPKRLAWLDRNRQYSAAYPATTSMEDTNWTTTLSKTVSGEWQSGERIIYFVVIMILLKMLPSYTPLLKPAKLRI